MFIMDFFGFLLFGIFLALWAYRFISFDKFGKFSVTISWSSFLTPPSFFSSGTLITQMLRLLLLPIRFLRLCCFFFFFPPFLSVDTLSGVQNESFLLFYLPVYWSFFSLFYSAVEFIHWAFILAFVFFCSKMSICLFFIPSILFAETFYIFAEAFCFFHLIQACS